MTLWIGRRQTGQCFPDCLSRRAQRKQQAWCPVDPCTILAFFGATRHIRHTDDGDVTSLANRSGPNTAVRSEYSPLFLALSPSPIINSRLPIFVATMFSEVFNAAFVADTGVSANCIGISTLSGKAGLCSSVLKLTSQLPGDMPESKLAGRDSPPNPGELRDSTVFDKSLCSSVVGRCVRAPLLGSQSGRRFQQKSQYRCSGKFSFSQTEHSHLSYDIH